MIAAVSNRSLGRNVHGNEFNDDDFILSNECIHIVLEGNTQLNSLSVLLIINDMIANSVGKVIISHFSMSLIGLVKGHKTYGDIYASKDLTKVIIVITHEIPEAQSYSLSSQIINLNPNQILILDGYRRSKIRSQQLNEKQIRYLQTSSVLETFSPKLLGVPSLDIGAIVAGLTASMLTSSEMRHVPVVAVFAIRESSYSISSASSFESIWPLLQRHFECNDEGASTTTSPPLPPLPLPSRSDYALGVGRDPFMSRTENLYT